MATATVKGKIGAEDINCYDGRTTTFTRLTSVGGSITLSKFGSEVDVAVIYGSGSPSDTAISDAIDALGASSRTLLLRPGTWSITDNLSIPANFNLRIPPGAILSIDDTMTLTINGPIEAGPYQIFSLDGTGTVAFGSGYVTEILPEWWGAVGDGTTDSSAAILAATKTGKPLRFQAGTYIYTNVSLANGDTCIWRGAGRGQTILKHKAASTASGLTCSAVDGTVVLARAEISSMSIDGNMANITSRTICPIDIAADHFYMRDFELYNSIKAGIRLRGLTYTGTIEDFWMYDFAEHSGVAGQDVAGILIEKFVASNSILTIKDGIMEMTTAPTGAGNSAPGIESAPSTNQTLHISNITCRNLGMDIAGNSIAPIQIYRYGDDSIIRDCKIYDTYWGGIKVQQSNNVLVEGNLVSGEGTMGATRVSAISVQGRTGTDPMYNISVVNNSVINTPTIRAYNVIGDSTGEFYNVELSGNYAYNALSGLYCSYLLGKNNINYNTFQNLVGTNTSVDFGIHLTNLFTAEVNVIGNKTDSVAGGIYIITNLTGAKLRIKDNDIDVSDAGSYNITVQGASSKAVTVANVSGNNYQNAASRRHTLVYIDTLILNNNISASLTTQTITNITAMESTGNSWQTRANQTAKVIGGVFPVVAEGTTVGKAKTTNAITYVINGLVYTKAGTDNLFDLTAVTTGAAEYKKVLLLLDSTGTGHIQEGVAAASQAAAQLPLVWTDRYCPVGVVEIPNNYSGGDLAGYTFYDLLGY